MIPAIVLAALGLLVNMFIVEFYGGEPLWLFVSLACFALVAMMAISRWHKT